MKGFLLFLVALLGFVLTMPIAFVVSIISNRLNFMAYAISLDQTINAIAANLLNFLWLINSQAMPFGDMDKTISYNLGRNKKHKNLNAFGLFICSLLDWIDPNHVERAYQNNI